MNTSFGSVLIDDWQTPPPKKKCLFSEIDFPDVSDDFKQKKKNFLYKNFFWTSKIKKKIDFFLLLEIESEIHS